MKLPLTTKDKVETPLKGFAFAFIDEDDKKLKIKTHDSIIEFTNDLSDISDIQLLDLLNKSTFEVMPNKTEILSGTIDDVTGLTYSRAVPACTIHKMTLRSAQEPEECDVVIDWGDGTVEAIKDMTWTTTTHTVGKSYELEHDYAPNMTEDVQRFIVKIYGKDYYTFRHNLYKDNNLISRIFDADLPLSININNVASMAYNANRLLLVKFPSYTAPYSDIWNWGSVFSMCNNLQSVTGFTDILIKDNSKTASIFGNSKELVETDFVFNRGATSIVNFFLCCNKLEKDIAEFFPKGGFLPGTISVGAVFYGCKKLTGTVPADILWNDKNITWTNTEKAFFDCSTEIRKQVPVSWGGTNKMLDAELKLKQLKVNANEYSAFEVMPNKTEIPSGTIDDVTGLTYNINIPACTIHKMTLRSAQEPEECDVVIDWGDGTVESIKAGNYVSHVEGKSYELSHDYATNMSEDVQRFIVKIYGKDYYTFRHNSYANNNLISRVFDAELPMASHITNFASMCFGAMRLLKVKLLHSTSPYINVINWSSCFHLCQNLISVTGFENSVRRNNVNLSSIIKDCTNLIETDLKLLSCASDHSGMFQNCINLEKDINDLLPKYGFGTDKVNLHCTFANMKKLYGTIDSKMLWNNPNKDFLDLKYTIFGGCSDEIRAQVPISWGGTVSDDI